MVHITALPGLNDPNPDHFLLQTHLLYSLSKWVVISIWLLAFWETCQSPSTTGSTFLLLLESVIQIQKSPWLADTTPTLRMCTEIMHYIDWPLVILIYYLFFSIKANWSPHLFSQCKQTFPASSLSKLSYRNLSLILFGQVSRGMDMLIPAGGISQCRSFELGAVQLLESLLLTWETWKQLIVADIAGINHYVDGLYLCLLEWKRLSSSYIFSLYCRSPCPNMAETSTTTEQVLIH